MWPHVYATVQKTTLTFYFCEIKFRISRAKGAFNRKTLFTSTLHLHLRKNKLRCYIWSIAFYGAKTWTLWKVDQKYLELLKCGAGERWRKFDRSCEK
jgi:hypothetical protein